LAEAARSALGFYRDKSSRGAEFLPHICKTIGLQKAHRERSAQSWGLVEIPQKAHDWATDTKRGLVETSQSLSDETNAKKRAHRTEQLRKLGKLQCYYLDKFNQNGVFIRHKQKCKAALQSGPRSDGELLPGVCWFLGIVQLPRSGVEHVLSFVCALVKFLCPLLSFSWSALLLIIYCCA
jgi:hypothetical protein